MIGAPYLAAFYTTRAFLPWMLARRTGVCLYMNSAASRLVWPGAAAYTADQVWGLLAVVSELSDCPVFWIWVQEVQALLPSERMIELIRGTRSVCAQRLVQLAACTVAANCAAR